METQKESKKDVYSIVTDQIIAQLEQGKIPWHQPWVSTGGPRNLITMKHYRGINTLLLGSLGYPRNYFLTFKQVKKVGGSIKEGEKPHLIIFWRWDEEENGTKRAFLMYYRVYNIDQCLNIPKSLLPTCKDVQINTVYSCEEIITNMPNPPTIQFGDCACYIPKTDTLMMPAREYFAKIKEYYSTFFHELVHSTGHTSRLNREDVMKTDKMNAESYSFEELVAEIGACFLIAYAGIGTEDMNNNIAYLQGWLQRLKDDRKFIIIASASAQKAVDYILDITFEKN